MESARRFLLSVAALAIGLVAAACEESTGPLGNFLIRQPTDDPRPPSPYNTVRTVTAGDTATILFEWQEAKGATRYEIAFWSVASADSMNNLRADTNARPTFSIRVDQPERVSAPYSLSLENDRRRVWVIQRWVQRGELAAAMDAAGFPPDGTNRYFVWSIFAEKGSSRKRSAEVHRMILQYTE